jgi:hypothetical protein
MPPDQHEILTQLQISMAEIRTELKYMRASLDQAVVARNELEGRLVPLTEHMNRWRGALVVITFIAGGIGAAVTTILKQAFAGPSP